MPMNRFKQTYSSNILQFPDIDYGKKEIVEYLDRISNRLNLQEIPTWTLVVSLVFSKADWIGTFKRGTSYPSTKEKYVSIVIPIPDSERVTYGIARDRFLPRPKPDPSHFWTQPVNYDEYNSMRDLIVDSAKRGIDEAFKHGVTVHGKKVKYRDL